MIDGVVDNQALLSAFKRLIDSAKNPSPVLKAIGEDLIESTKERFVNKVGPDGKSWDDNAASTIDNKGRNDPLVGETGSLNSEIFYNLVGNDELEIGSTMIYAAMQQFGGSKSEFPHLWSDIPARPFLGFSTQDDANILQTINDYLSGSI
jgi:phage virion morphogenesis protein